MVEAGAADGAEQVGLQAAARLEMGAAAPKAQERFLGGVLSGLGVAEQARGEAHQAGLVGRHDLAERLRVPVRRPPHQSIVIHRPLPPVR